MDLQLSWAREQFCHGWWGVVNLASRCIRAEEAQRLTIVW
jgi:hypothetical protein